MLAACRPCQGRRSEEVAVHGRHQGPGGHVLQLVVMDLRHHDPTIESRRRGGMQQMPHCPHSDDAGHEARELPLLLARHRYGV